MAFTGVFLYATHDQRLVGDARESRRIREEGRLFPIGLAAYTLAIALALVAPVASLAVYGLTALFYALPILPLPTRSARHCGPARLCAPPTNARVVAIARLPRRARRA